MPNLLFLYTDEQRFDTLAANGGRAGVMPNLERLAARSTNFSHTYCTQPICTPARGSILTGLFSHAHGATINNLAMRRQVPCLPEFLPAGSHHCAHMGKWHLGDEIFPQHGFAEWVGTEDAYHAGYSPPVEEFGPERSPYHHWLVSRGVQPWDLNASRPPERRHQAFINRFMRDQLHALPEEHCKPAFLAERAIEFLQVNRQRPWVLYVNFLEPHPPIASCRDHQYDPADVDLAWNWDRELADDQPLRLQLRAKPAAQRSEDELRRTTARYWGMNSLVDTHIGRILDCLETTGGFEDTIIVLTSDHGDMMGSYGMSGKSQMFDEAARVPLLIHSPGQSQAHRCDAPVSQIDLVPTLLDLMDQPRPDNLHGASLRAQVEGRSRETGRDVFLQWNTCPDQPQVPGRVPAHLADSCSPEQAGAAQRERVRSVVSSDGWKLNRSSIGDHELYDLATDPCERHNLYREPDHRTRCRELNERLDTWIEGVGDTTAPQGP